MFSIHRADEVKEHAFFGGLDWQQVYLQKYQPPLIPPRGEVNAADAFDIGSFDEEDTKGIKVIQVILCVVMCFILFSLRYSVIRAYKPTIGSIWFKMLVY